MPRTPALVGLLILIAAGPVGAQVLDDTLVPGGSLGFEISPVFSSWDTRFGRSAGVNRRESLAEDLTTDAAQTLYPGAESLRAAIAALSGNAGYSPILGVTQAHVSKDVTRVEFAAHVGVLDWLTVGAVLPWSRTRTSFDLHFRPDTLAGDLGVNPTISNATNVTSFLQALANAEAAAQTNATQVCTSSPGSPACANAQALATRTASFRTSASNGYGASAFFPLASTATATALAQSVSTLSSDLVAAGLGPISVAMPFAAAAVDEEDFWTLPLLPEAGVQALGPLASVKAPWYFGDLEVSATVRVLEGRRGNVAYRLLATALGRLPTGQVDSLDVLLDVGTGDGQADLEGRLLAQLRAGSRLGLALGARYGVQRPRTLVRRVAPPEVAIPAAATRHTVEWTPGAFYGLEIAPTLYVSDELSFSAEYRGFRKYRDRYELAGSSVGAPVDPSVLEVESGVTVHEVGGSLRYDSLARWLGEGARPMQVNFRFVRAVAGGGGQTPVTTQVELGVRLFRSLWGG